MDIQEIRLLPMSKEEFDNKSLAVDFLMKGMNYGRGIYHYRRRNIRTQSGVLVLFQYGGELIASAILVSQKQETMTNGDVTYNGYYEFDTDSVRVFKTGITSDEFRKIDDTFKYFNQSAKIIEMKCLGEICRLIDERTGGLETAEVNYDLETAVRYGKEGSRKCYYTTKYERKAENREAAKRIHGTRCMVCGFDFEEVYGVIGRDYIEVHHIKPLFSLTEEVVINPEEDMICVCANCHRMLHRYKDKIMTAEELREMVGERRRKAAIFSH